MMRSSTARSPDRIDHFGESFANQSSLLNEVPRQIANFGETAARPLPEDFDPEAARLAGRIVAANTSSEEFDDLIKEHAALVEVKLAGNATNAQIRRLAYVRWNLDNIEDALYGEGLDLMERDISEYERFCGHLDGFIERLKGARV